MHSRRPIRELLEEFRIHHDDHGDAIVAAILYVGDNLQYELRQILAALPGDHMTPEDRAAIRDATAKLRASEDAIRAAITTNTPAEDSPVVL